MSAYPRVRMSSWDRQ